VANETGIQRFPVLKDLMTFMEQKCQVLDTVKPFTNTADVKERH
jgi:succinate dehydrogenase/fumarate reductase-like Fe-S protein